MQQPQTTVPRSMHRYQRIVGSVIPLLSTRPASRATLGPWIRSDRAAEYLDQRVATRPPFPVLEVVRYLQVFPGSSRPRRRALSTQQAFPVRCEPSRQAAARKQVRLRNFRPTSLPAGLGLGKSQTRFEETASVRKERACLRVPSRLKNPNPAKTLAPESPTGAPKGVAPQELRANWEFRHSRRSSGWTHRKRLPRWTPPAVVDLPKETVRYRQQPSGILGRPIANPNGACGTGQAPGASQSPQVLPKP